MQKRGVQMGLEQKLINAVRNTTQQKERVAQVCKTPHHYYNSASMTAPAPTAINSFKNNTASDVMSLFYNRIARIQTPGWQSARSR
jgi:hypothetical protein